MRGDHLSTFDRGVEGMRAAAGGGRPVRADAFLTAEQAAADPELAVDLVYAEYLIRCDAGDPPPPGELAGRFPPLADRVRRQLALHTAMESVGSTRVYSGTPPTSSPATAAANADPPYIGRYRVIHRLGRGGQATAYRAFHPDLQRDVVVKWGHAPADALREEARVIAALDHPNLVRVHDFDTHDGRPFIVIEFVPARTLAAEAAVTRVSPARAAEVVAAAARGCGHAHRRGVVHRDLKPENVLLDDTGRVRVIDFGLAALLGGEPDGEGGVTGTLRYMAPEQARGEAAGVGPRTDVFGLGGILYFLLTGSPLYPGGQAEVLPRAAAGDWDRGKLAVADAPAWVKAACAKALAANPHDRFRTADEFATALTPPVRRWWPWVAAAGLALALAGAAGWHVARPRSDATPAVSAPAQPELQVRVWDDGQGRYRQLAHMLPLTTGERVRFEATAPTDRYLTLFVIDASGQVRLVADSPPRAEVGVIGFPADPTQASELTPPGGTVVVLLCGRADRPVSADEVTAALGGDPWPALPKGSVVQVDRDAVTAADGSRGVGPPTGQPDPEGDTVRRLDAARTRLGSTCDVLAGVAFSHR